MHLNERLQICLLALASRHPLHTVDIDERIVGSQSFRLTGWTALGLIEQLQRSRPDLLQAQARIVLDEQQCGIYLIDLSEEQPAFSIHCWGRVLSPTTGELVNVPVEGCPEA